MSSPLGEDEEWVLLMLDKVVDEEQLAVRLKIVNENLLQSTTAGSAQNLSDSHFELLTKGCVHWLTRGDGLVLGEPTARLLATLVTVCATRQQNRQELFSPDFCAKLIHGTTGRFREFAGDCGHFFESRLSSSTVRGGHIAANHALSHIAIFPLRVLHLTHPPAQDSRFLFIPPSVALRPPAVLVCCI